MGIVYEANVAHKDWGGTASPNDRWRKTAAGWWEISFDSGVTWRRSFFTWDDKVTSGALVSINAPHTDADLAMALELAEADENSCEDFNDAYVACDPRNGNPIYTWDWLRQQVIDALRARGEGQR